MHEPIYYVSRALYQRLLMTASISEKQLNYARNNAQRLYFKLKMQFCTKRKSFGWLHFLCVALDSINIWKLTSLGN